MAVHDHAQGVTIRPISLKVAGQSLHGDLGMPPEPKGLVLFAHGSGSGRHSPRNQLVARALERHGLATLLVDLLTAAEGAVDSQTSQYRFDIVLLSGRLVAIVDALKHDELTASLPIGIFGASTGAAAAVVAAGERPKDVAALVSRGGRPDLAAAALPRVAAPTLLIVGGRDQEVLRLNREAIVRLPGEAMLEIVPGATHLFEEAGTLEHVARLAADWFSRHLAAPLASPSSGNYSGLHPVR